MCVNSPLALMVLHLHRVLDLDHLLFTEKFTYLSHVLFRVLFKHCHVYPHNTNLVHTPATIS